MNTQPLTTGNVPQAFLEVARNILLNPEANDGWTLGICAEAIRAAQARDARSLQALLTCATIPTSNPAGSLAQSAATAALASLLGGQPGWWQEHAAAYLQDQEALATLTTAHLPD